jgi:glycosyltransferase involved in cell wall biosynthesis
MLLSVIMPVYNERDTLTEILSRVEAVPVDKEIIIVDDGSTDGTRQILKDIKAENIKVIFHERNQGKGAAIKTGLREATGDVVIMQDADLEYDPMDYLKLIPLIQSGEAQVVFGSRTLGSKERSYHRYYWGGQFVTFVANLLYGLKITDEPTCYKMFRKEVMEQIKLDCIGFEFCPEVTAKVARLGYTIHEVPVSYHPRSFKEGKKIKWKDGLIAIWTLLKYRFLPMHKIVKS